MKIAIFPIVELPVFFSRLNFASSSFQGMLATVRTARNVYLFFSVSKFNVKYVGLRWNTAEKYILYSPFMGTVVGGILTLRALCASHTHRCIQCGPAVFTRPMHILCSLSRMAYIRSKIVTPYNSRGLCITVHYIWRAGRLRYIEP